jgi:hypothetical protein
MALKLARAQCVADPQGSRVRGACATYCRVRPLRTRECLVVMANASGVLADICSARHSCTADRYFLLAASLPAQLALWSAAASGACELHCTTHNTFRCSLWRMQAAKWSFFDALYFNCMSFTTVGIGRA